MLRARSLIRVVLALPLVLTATSSVAAQGIAPLVLEGEALPDGSTVAGVRAVNVDYFGGALVLVSTRAPGGTGRGVALLGGGFVYMQTGGPVQSPVGATIAELDSVSTNLFGGVCWNTRLAGTAAGLDDDEAVYLDSDPWMREGPTSDTPMIDPLPAGSRWLSFADVRMASADGLFMVRGSHIDPSLPGTSQTFLAHGYPTGVPFLLGNVDRIVAAGQEAPGLGVPLADIRLAPAAASVSPNTRMTMWSARLRAAAAADACVYRYNTANGEHLLVAREGEPSTLGGLPWGPLEELALDVASSGRWTLRATVVDGSGAQVPVIMNQVAVLARGGDPAPGLAPAVYAGFGRGPALVDDLGNLVWYARLEGPAGTREVIYANQRPVVQTGVTRIGGRLVEAIGAGADMMSLGPTNGVLAFEATLEGGVSGAFLLDLDG